MCLSIIITIYASWSANTNVFLAHTLLQRADLRFQVYIRGNSSQRELAPETTVVPERDPTSDWWYLLVGECLLGDGRLLGGGPLLTYFLHLKYISRFGLATLCFMLLTRKPVGLRFSSTTSNTSPIIYVLSRLLFYIT